MLMKCSCNVSGILRESAIVFTGGCLVERGFLRERDVKSIATHKMNYVYRILVRPDLHLVEVITERSEIDCKP